MIDNLDQQLGFAPDYDSPVPYMKRTRDYYIAIGYTTPYRWAHHLAAPFQPLNKPLKDSRVTIVTTAAPYDPAKGDQGPGAAYNGGAKFYQVYAGDTTKQHDLRISHIGYDRKHTTATDSGTWFPLPALIKAQQSGRIGEVAPRFFGAPTNRSHSVTIETDAPEMLARAKADKVDVAVIVPNCPVCHQTSAWSRDIWKPTASRPSSWAAPRTSSSTPRCRASCSSDFPLGNSAGKPHDPESQALTLELALRVLEAATGPQHHDAVAAALERGRQMEAGLPQHRADGSRGAGAPAPRVRPAKGNRARASGGVMISPSPRFSGRGSGEGPLSANAEMQVEHWCLAPHPHRFASDLSRIAGRGKEARPTVKQVYKEPPL